MFHDNNYLGNLRSSDTVNLYRPFLLLLLRTFLPSAVLIRSRKPWVLYFFTVLG